MAYGRRMTWDDVVTLIRDTPPAHLATVDATGHPHVSVIGVGVDGPILWFATRPTSGKARNLAAEPRLALMVAGNGAETYVKGTADLVDDLAEKQRLWTSGILPYDPTAFFGPPETADVVLVRVTPTSAVAMVRGDEGPQRRRWSA